MACSRLVPLGIPAILLAACMTAVSPEQAEREAVMWAAARECQAQYLTIERIDRIDHYGRIWFTYQGGGGENQAFTQCYQQRVHEKTGGRGLISAGRPAAGSDVPSRVTVPVEITGNLILVPVVLNETVTGRLMLDTGASKTIIRPALMERVGLTASWTTQRQVAHVVGGREVSMPLLRLRSLKLGALVVEDLDVAAFDALPHLPAVEGLLGADVLSHFTVTVDRQQRRLVLEQRPADGTSAPTAAPPRDIKVAAPPAATPAAPWEAPRWAAGDEWRFRWESPAGSGTFVRTVEREERIDGQEYYVVRSGSRRSYYTKPALAWHRDVVDGVVVARASPPVGYEWPLEVGKRWELTFDWENPPERQQERRYRQCEVGGEEVVTVPAGTFTTRRIVCRDRLRRLVTETWEAVDLKHWVKERTVMSYGDRVRELVEYRLR